MFQTVDDERFVVDCKMNPAELVGHERTRLEPDRLMVRNGDVGGAAKLKR